MAPRCAANRLNFKQLILGTPLGRLAQFARDSATLIHALITRPERVGTELNDRLATYLITRLPCARFVDVGAHIGSVVAMVRHHSRAKVIAVEAMPDKAAALRRKFPDVVVHGCAVGEKTGEVSFFVMPKLTGTSSLVRNQGSVEISVPLRRLDELVSEPVDMMKIDVEGAELGVLRGAEHLIANSRPVIMFESGPGEQMYSQSALWEWLSERRYEILTPDRMAHTGPALSCEGFSESHFYPRRTTNYFAVPAERRAQVRAMARQLLRLGEG
jgi:FkbM family methyltransferase